MTAERLTPLLVGPCPKDWRQPCIEEITDLLTNGFVGPSLPHQTENSETGICYLQGFNVRPNNLDLSRTTWVTHDFHAKNRKSQLREGDVLVVQSGHIGTAAVVPREAAGSNCHAVIICRFNSSIVDSSFASQYLNSQIGQARLRGLHVGSSLPHINTSELGRFKLPLPPLREQRKLAALWVTWDTAIQKTERLIAAKERYYSHELSRLISRGQHPHGSPAPAKAGVSAFAEEVSKRNRRGKWRTVALSDIATVWKGQQLNKDIMVEDGTYYALNGGIKPSGRTTEWNCEADTITVSEGDNSCGFVSYNRERFWCGGHCYAVKRLAKDVDVHYLFHFLKGKQVRLMALRVGSGLPNIQKSDIEAFSVVLPDLTTQTAIARYLNALRDEIDLLGQSIAAIKAQKRGLMQKLLTGQWRLLGDSNE